MWETTVIVGLGVVCLLGVLMTTVRLPGTWLIVAAAAGYGWWSDWRDVTVTIVVVLGGAAIVGELLELLMSVFAVRRAGASGRASWGGLIGGFLGMIFLSFLIPIPLVGAMFGALLGCFAGSMLGELSAGRKLTQGTKVGVFAAIGFALGTALKMAIALAMAGGVMAAALFSGGTVGA